MDKKLTLSLDQKVIERAKKFAKRNKTSLSRMIEAYFESLTSESEDEAQTITPLVESLSGVVRLSRGYDYKSSRQKHREEKHR